MINRRQILQAAAAGLILPCLASAATASGPVMGVWILRGGLDGLSMLPPVGDPDYARARGRLALSRKQVTMLDNTFGLHPAMEFVAQCWKRGEASVAHAVATPYRDRSHFDAQNILETGLGEAGTYEGWANRLVSIDPGLQLLGIGSGTPVILRGSNPVESFSPTATPGMDESTLERILALYAKDARLGPGIEEAMALRELAGGKASMRARRGPGKEILGLAQAAGRLEAARSGPRLHVLSDNGWDTHARQGNADGVLTQRLANLDKALKAYRDAAGDAWNRSIIVVVTEFGRTVEPNGTGGSDHGTGSAMLLLGGGLGRTKVHADWPGLSSRSLHEGRDLRPTIDTRSVFAAVLEQHLGFSRRDLSAQVFPGLSGTRLPDIV